MKPEIEAYLLTMRLLSVIDELDLPNNGFKKSVRSINTFAERSAQNMEDWNSDVNERIVHNFNVIVDNISDDVLVTPIGVLEVDTI